LLHFSRELRLGKPFYFRFAIFDCRFK
jgi:hypothetical protein